jgi:hypothetical protein
MIDVFILPFVLLVFSFSDLTNIVSSHIHEKEIPWLMMNYLFTRRAAIY